MSPRDASRDRWTDAAVALVTAAVVVSPWLFGSADAWAWLLMCLLVGAGTAAWLLSVVVGSAPPLRAPALTAALMLLLAFVGAQSLRLPPGVVRAVSPASARVHAGASAALARADVGAFLPHGVGPLAGPALSAAPLATRRSPYLLLAYVGAFLVPANCLRRWTGLRRVATALVVGGFLMAVFGLVQKLSGTRSIYWFHVPRFGGDIFGPFTNRNHFAAHMNMTLGIAVGLLLATAHAAMPAGATCRERLAALSTARAGAPALLAFAAAIMAASVCATLSRAGILSLVLSGALLGAVAAARRALPVGRAAVAAAALIFLLAVGWLGWRPVIERMGTLANVTQEPSGRARLTATVGTLEVFGAWPAFGCGFGAFQHAFPRFQDPGIQFARWLHAHNDYAQLLAEGGVVGALLALGAALLLAGTLLKGYGRAGTRGRLMAAGLALALLAVAVHSLFDYSLHKPANGLRLAAVCGMAVAAVHLRRRERPRTERHERGSRHGLALIGRRRR